MARLRMLACAVPLLALLVLPGCVFPIELDVSKDGKILIPRQEGFFVLDPKNGQVRKICKAEGGQPVFARFSPDGKEILTVTGLRDTNQEYWEYQFATVPLAGGKPRPLIKVKNASYVSYSPDGTHLAVVAFCEVKGGEGQKLTELTLVPLNGGPTKVIATNIASRVRWFADSKRLLVFEPIDERVGENSYVGNLAILDVTTGKSTPLVKAACGVSGDLSPEKSTPLVKAAYGIYFDLAPDNRKVLFTAFGAGKPDAKLEDVRLLPHPNLYEIDVADATFRNTGRQADFAIYSPDGKRVLVCRAPTEKESSDFSHLKVADANLRREWTVAFDSYPRHFAEKGTYPGWVDNQTIFYFSERNVYGTDGKSLNLMTVGIDAKDRKLQQPFIDMEAFK